MKATVRIALLCAAVAILILGGARCYYAWRYDSNFNHAAGVWVALASDFSHGLFYRPVYSEQYGYGGTRYFPLQFVVLGVLLRFGGDPRVTGYLLAVATMGTLLAGLFVLLRRLAVPPRLASMFCALVLATRATQLPLLTVRGDALPAAAYLWGLVLCVGDGSRRRFAAAAVLFAVAFAAKITAGYVVVAVVLSLMLSRRFKDAIFLLVLSSVGFATVLLAIYAASGGRVLEIMRETLAAGSSGQSLAGALLSFLRVAYIHDPAVEGFLLISVMALLLLKRSDLSRVPPVLFIVAVAMTSVTLTSRGTDYNHFLDVQLAAIVLLAFAWTHQRPESAPVLPGAVALVAIAAVAPLWSSLVEEREHATPGFDQTVNFLKNRQGPILAENPLISVLAGERPYVLDPFVLQTIASRRAGFDSPIVERLSRREFGAVVLVFDPRTPWGRDWYASYHFGTRVIEAIETNYVLRQQFDDRFILLPLPP